ncbi:MAG: redoxin domain-containing protein [Planctomycetaceae bacterium]
MLVQKRSSHPLTAALLRQLLVLMTLSLTTARADDAAAPAAATTEPATATEAAAPQAAESSTTEQPADTAATENATDANTAAEDDPVAGHSYHSEVFNDGPRQQAYLIGGTGAVHFPCTTKVPQVQAFIDQGVGQLHGFWYYEAERSFRQAAMLDPECAIAYWGMAMANESNKDRAEGFIKEAHEKRQSATRREQLYIEALHAFITADTKAKEWDKKRRQAIIKAYEDLSYEFPDDVEAKAFLALELYEGRSKGIPIASYVAYDALMQDILAVNPAHPCHHYVIHLWDYEKPERALKASAACGPAAPAIAHMWHMPGHIYSRLKRYHDAVYQQEASARVDHAHMMRDRVLPDQIHNFAHNNEWLIRNLIFIGRAGDAIDLAKNMIDLPRHPKFNTPSSGSANYGRLRLVQALEDFELWSEVLALADTHYLQPPEKEEDQWSRDRLIARAAFATGDAPRATAIRDRLREQQTKLEGERDEAVAKAVAEATEANKDKEEKERDKAIEEAKKKALDKFNGRLGKLGQIVFALDMYEHLQSEGWKAAQELLTKAGSQPAALKALIQLKAGETDPALETIQKEVDRRRNETIPLAHQVWLQWQAEKRDDAKATFEKLRKISASIDRSVPLFARLDPIAVELGWPEDWREPLEPATDLGERPDLASLGPFRWQPQAAPDWSLVDHEDKSFNLAQYRGKPVIVIFYLGYGCLHCAEQLQKFAPAAARYNAAGIELVAISTDDKAGLVQSHENYRDGTFPFPLVANEEMNVFRAYRCYDDFEDQPLHGTFLIDADGLVRWQDISFEPFMDAEFLLKETCRLLDLPYRRLNRSRLQSRRPRDDRSDPDEPRQRHRLEATATTGAPGA